MLDTYTSAELGRLVGHETRDPNGESVGYVDLIFVDHDVASAPSYDEEDDRGLIVAGPEAVAISAEKEIAAYEHYGLDPSGAAREGTVRLRALVVAVRRGS